ncbi:MAG TPA: hypothetical protein VKN73_15390, partial [Desulfosalsimonadaceae bacterium]|nr:hypothetical protein [Desulfosalsimonadaceae bacterium]
MHHIKKNLFHIQRLGIGLLLLAAVVMILPLGPAAAADTGKKVEKDTDEDGVIDQVLFFDKKGRIQRLKIDNNKDGRMDQFQFYEAETIIRLE